jgi:ubiquinone/menaquinone biosynthesis C-methylase UbiE
MSEVTWQNVYSEHSDLYDEMIFCEDYQGNLFPALSQIHPFNQMDVAEFGAGTGRLTTRLVTCVRQVNAFDLTPMMLRRARQKLQTLNQSNWILGVADSRNIPLPTAKADIAIEGWSIAQIMAWNSDTWQMAVEAAINEMVRVVRPGGVIMLIETLGTGGTAPHAPERFVPLYDYFENHWQATAKWIRTDYCFPNRSIAQRNAGALFGDAVIDEGWETSEGYILPECTGIWWFRRNDPQN